MTTAAAAWIGDCVVAAPSATYRLRLPYGAGGARFYDLDPTTAIDVTLPDARLVRTGMPIYRILNSSANAITLKDSAGTTIAAIAAGEVDEVGCVSNTTAAGTWYVIEHPAGTVTIGTPLTIGRQPWDISLDSQIHNWNLRRHLDSQGYPGVDPVAVRLTVEADAIIGSAVDGVAALDTGVFPAGSTLLLFNRGLIVGKGGRGGSGGNPGPFADGPGDGVAGGVGLYVRMNTVLSNHGIIAGGGGGGGGGEGDTSSSANPGGGGGGGGCGFLGGQGGAAPVNPNGATSGHSGGLYYSAAGGTGHNAGGVGGNLGVAGSAGAGAGGGAAGAAGSSITRLTAYTVTKNRTGTIAGPEVAV